MSYPQCSFIRLPRPWRVDYRYRKVISKKEGAHVISDCGFSEIPLNQPTLRRIDLGIGLGEHLLLNLIPNEFARALRENGSIAGAFRVDHSTGGQLAIVEMNQISGKRHGIASRNGTKTAWRTSNQDAIRPEHRAF